MRPLINQTTARLTTSAAVFSTCGVGFFSFLIACILSMPKQVSISLRRQDATDVFSLLLYI